MERNDKGKRLDGIQRFRRCLFVSSSNTRFSQILIMVAFFLVCLLIITMEVSWESQIKEKYDIDLLRKHNEDSIGVSSVPTYVNLCHAYVSNYEKLHSSDKTPLQKLYHHHREKKAEQNTPDNENSDEEEEAFLLTLIGYFQIRHTVET